MLIYRISPDYWLKRPEALADTCAVVRAAIFLALLAALAASGWTLVQKNFRPTPPSGTLPTAAEIAVSELESAAGVLERYHKLFLTYSDANLELFRGLRVAQAGESSYCLEVARDAGIWRLAGPGGTVAAGAC